MVGYRLALSLPYFPDIGNSSNGTAVSCNSQDDVKTAAILVCSNNILAGLLVSLGSCIFMADYRGP